jgi:hypothetical protein
MTRNTNVVNGGAMSKIDRNTVKRDRRHFIGGSDARIVMGKDEKALLRLWREKRGEEAARDLSSVLIVQLGLVIEDLNRRWYEINSGYKISDIQRHAIHRTIPGWPPRWMHWSRKLVRCLRPNSTDSQLGHDPRTLIEVISWSRAGLQSFGPINSNLYYLVGRP